jgi:hypothetical protein
MRINWRLGLVLGLAITVGASIARAQTGGASSTGVPAGGAAVSPTTGGDTNGGLSEPAQGDDALSHPNAATAAPPRPSRSAAFNRVTTGRREVVPAPSQARRAAGPRESLAVAGKTSASDALSVYRARAAQLQAKGAKDRASASSTWHEGPQRPMSPPPAMVRSTTHNYYPGMRPGQQPNANTPQAAHTGQRRPGMAGGALLGLGASTAKVARPAPGPSSSVVAPRR